MITHQFDDTIRIIPVGDVHLGAIEHDQKAWEDFLLRIRAADDTYVILLGDLLNNNTRSAVGNPFDEILRPMEQKKIMTEYLKPLADGDKILAMVNGNHEYRTAKESDQDLSYDIACRLGIENLYRPNMAFIKISLGRRGKSDDKQPNVSYHIACVHGNAGGALSGGVVNRNERSAGIIENCDCFLVGHSHKGMLTRPSKIVIDTHNNAVVLKSYLVASAESWMTYGGYAARKQLVPAEHGNPFVLTLINSKTSKRIEVTW